MTAYYHTLRNGLQELEVGAWVEIDGQRRRLVAINIEEATEAEPELGVEPGDLVTTIDLAEPVE